MALRNGRLSIPFSTTIPEVIRLLNGWASILNPLLGTTILQGVHLKNVELSSGSNVVSHPLGRLPQGYLICRVRSSHATFYDTGLTPSVINLEASAGCIIDLWVF